MTVTELNQAIITLINQAELPFDAKVFVVRSISAELEQKYTVWKQQMQMKQMQAKAQQESEEKQT